MDFFKEWFELALEMSETEGIDFDRALEIAAAEAPGLERYAEAWDTWAAAWRDSRTVITAAG